VIFSSFAASAKSEEKMTPPRLETLAPEAQERLAMAIQSNPHNAVILERLPSLRLADAWLVAGCLFQTVWNLDSGRPATQDIFDYDIFYFDEDISYEAEDRAIRRARALFADLPIRVDLKNQARVHLWYGERFGPGYPQLRSSADGVDRFLIECTRVAARYVDGALELYAPARLDDLFAGVLRPNPLNLRPELFAAKAASLRARWPFLTIAETHA
jgi:hypothetical protein